MLEYLIQRHAEKSGLTEAEAADQIDRAVHQLLKRLRQGKDAGLPKLGVLTGGDKRRLQTERDYAGKSI